MSAPEAQSDPYPFVFVNDDGSVRELHAAERQYLETPFNGADGARPYIKTSFDSRDGWGSRRGFCQRSKVPDNVPIAAAPADDPNPPMTAEQFIKWLQPKTGWSATQQPDGRVVFEPPKQDRR